MRRYVAAGRYQAERVAQAVRDIEAAEDPAIVERRVVARERQRREREARETRQARADELSWQFCGDSYLAAIGSIKEDIDALLGAGHAMAAGTASDQVVRAVREYYEQIHRSWPLGQMRLEHGRGPAERTSRTPSRAPAALDRKRRAERGPAHLSPTCDNSNVIRFPDGDTSS